MLPSKWCFLNQLFVLIYERKYHPINPSNLSVLRPFPTSNRKPRGWFSWNFLWWVAGKFLEYGEVNGKPQNQFGCKNVTQFLFNRGGLNIRLSLRNSSIIIVVHQFLDIYTFRYQYTYMYMKDTITIPPWLWTFPKSPGFGPDMQQRYEIPSSLSFLQYSLSLLSSL